MTLNRELESSFYKEEDGRALIKDGIEMSICVINRESREMQFSGAFLPVYIVRNDKLIEIKGDKINVGQTYVNGVSFNKSTFTLERGTYLTSSRTVMPTSLADRKTRKVHLSQAETYTTDN